MNCTKCGNVILEGRKFCTKCGAKAPELRPKSQVIQKEITFCPSCGYETENARGKFCPKCGTGLEKKMVEEVVETAIVPPVPTPVEPLKEEPPKVEPPKVEPPKVPKTTETKDGKNEGGKVREVITPENNGNHTEEENSQEKKKKKFPVWIPIVAGSVVLIAGIVVAVLLSGVLDNVKEKIAGINPFTKEETESATETEVEETSVEETTIAPTEESSETEVAIEETEETTESETEKFVELSQDEKVMALWGYAMDYAENTGNYFDYADFVYFTTSYDSRQSMKPIAKGVWTYAIVMVQDEPYLFMAKLDESTDYGYPSQAVMFTLFHMENDKVAQSYSTTVANVNATDYNVAVFVQALEDRVRVGVEYDGVYYLDGDGVYNMITSFEVNEDGFVNGDIYEVGGSDLSGNEIEDLVTGVNGTGIRVKTGFYGYDEDMSFMVSDDPDVKILGVMTSRYNSNAIEMCYEDPEEYEDGYIEAGNLHIYSTVNHEKNSNSLEGLSYDFAETEWVGDDGTVIYFRNDGTCIYREPENSVSVSKQVGIIGKWWMEGEYLRIDVTVEYMSDHGVEVADYSLYALVTDVDHDFSLQCSTDGVNWNPEIFNRILRK